MYLHPRNIRTFNIPHIGHHATYMSFGFCYKDVRLLEIAWWNTERIKSFGQSLWLHNRNVLFSHPTAIVFTWHDEPTCGNIIPDWGASGLWVVCIVIRRAHQTREALSHHSTRRVSSLVARRQIELLQDTSITAPAPAPAPPLLHHSGAASSPAVLSIVAVDAGAVVRRKSRSGSSEALFPATTPRGTMGISDPVYMSRKIRKFRTDKFDTWNKRKFWLMQLM